MRTTYFWRLLLVGWLAFLVGASSMMVGRAREIFKPGEVWDWGSVFPSIAFVAVCCAIGFFAGRESRP